MVFLGLVGLVVVGEVVVGAVVESKAISKNSSRFGDPAPGLTTKSKVADFESELED